MDKETLLQIISEGEGLQVEFKKAANSVSTDAYETIVSFSNSQGGTLILGVDDDGNVEGVNNTAMQQMLKDLVSGLNSPDNIYPPLYLQPQAVALDGSHIIVLQVPVSSQVHKLKQKQIYIREFESDIDISKNDTRISELYRSKSSTFSESEIIPNLGFEDLDSNLFDKARQLIRNYQSDHPWLMIDNKAMLREATLWRKDFYHATEGYTLAAALIFGKDTTIQSLLPAYKVEALVRRVNPDRWDDRLQPLRTNLIDTYLQLKAFINRHLPEKFFTEGDQRIDLRDKIFREVIGNVIVHREYRSAMATELRIEKSRVVLTNPNNPHGMGPIDLESFSPHPKNPNIRKFFTALGWTDEIGSGIRNTKKYLPLYVEGAKPQFVEGHTFSTTIPLKHATMFNFAAEWMRWMDFPEAQKTHIGQALKKIPLMGEAVEMDWNLLLAHLVASWNQKGIKLPELDWPKKQPLTIEEIKKVPGWNEKGIRLLHKKAAYLISILTLAAHAISLEEMMAAIGYANKATFRENYLKPLLTAGLIAKTEPGTPSSPKQKYLTTQKGIHFLTQTGN